MLRTVLWNTNRQPVAPLCQKLASDTGANILILLEAAESVAAFLDQLNSDGQGRWHHSPGNCERVTIFTAFSPNFVHLEEEGPHFTMRRIALPRNSDILLVAVHLRSKLHQSEKSQPYEAVSVMKTIRALESRLGHKRTVLAGDFNMDPFEDGMLSTMGFHSFASRGTVSEGSRRVMGEDFDYFHNPMWGLFSDGQHRPHGTYRYWSSEHVCQEWHLFDQVLVRPTLMHRLPAGSLRILQSAGATPLTSARGTPSISDHLPLFFELRSNDD